MANIDLNFDELLEGISRLPLDDQEMLLEIIKKRQIEQGRLEIAREARKAMREYRAGLTKRGSVEDLFKDLESD
jgi:hypothetical protein